MRWLRWIAFVLFLAVLCGYEAYALFVETPDPSQHMPPAKDVHLSREVSGGCQLMQTFIVHADGFSALEIFPKPSTYPPQGVMTVQVSVGRTSTFTMLVNRQIDSASVDLTRPFRIPVPRVDDSAGQLFMLGIWLPHAEQGHGLRFEQGGETYTDGKMSIGCTSTWGDLKFRTEVQRMTIVSNVQHIRRTLPPWLQSDAALLSVLLVGNLALAMVVYGLAFAPEPADREERQEREDRDQLPPNGSAATIAVQPRV